MDKVVGSSPADVGRSASNSDLHEADVIEHAACKKIGVVDTQM